MDLLNNKKEIELSVFISDYDCLFVEKEESNPPPKDFKHRHVHTLFPEEEGLLFQKLINNKSHKDQVNILIKTMELAISLNKGILTQKLAAIIAMKIKDKKLSKIRQIFK